MNEGLKKTVIILCGIEHMDLVPCQCWWWRPHNRTAEVIIGEYVDDADESMWMDDSLQNDELP